MKMRLLLAISLMGMGPLAFAAGPITIEMQMRQQVEVEEPDGGTHTKLVPLDKVVPGTIVTYLIHYENKGQEAATEVVLHDPIPEHMIYVGGSAQGEGTVVSYSVDGGENWADRVGELTIDGAGGQERMATAADVTTLRWQLKGSLAAGEKGQVRFAAELE